MMFGLVRFGALAVAEHRPQRALRLFAAASVLGDGGNFDFVRRRLMLDQHIGTTYELIDKTLAESLLSAGRALTLEQAVDEALATEQDADPRPRKHQLGGPLG